MCYSAQIKADYQRFVRTFGARLDLQEFIRLYWEREQGRAIKIPKAVDALFAQPQSEDEQSAYFGERDRRFRERDRFGGFWRCAVSIVDFLVSFGRVRAPERWV